MQRRYKKKLTSSKELQTLISVGGRGQGVGGRGAAAPQLGKYSFHSGKFFSKTIRVKLYLTTMENDFSHSEKHSKRYLTALTACEASFNLFSMVY